MSPELLATHQIISLFETSKNMSDEIFDNFSGAFLNVDSHGQILRANKFVTAEMSIDQEDALGANISQLFSNSGWDVFISHFKLLVTGEARSAEFELPMAMADGSLKDFLWQVTTMVAPTPTRSGVFTCLGRDISDFKGALAKTVTLTKDLEVAEAVQTLLLPSERELKTQQLHMASYYSSAAISGGDFWSFDFVAPDRVWVMVGDVTGHGAGPAMVTAMVAGCMGTLKHVAKSGVMNVTLESAIGLINQNLLNLTGQPYWMTLAAVELDLESNKVTWWGAGAPPIFLINKATEAQVLWDGSNPLGAGDCQLASGQMPFVSGDRLVLLTDGILELENRSGVQLGSARIKRFLEKNRASSAAEGRDQILALLQQWSDGLRPEDDITCIFVDRA